MKRLQILSDLHLDYLVKRPDAKSMVGLFKRIPIKPCAEYLALCGDIAEVHNPVYENFLTAISPLYRKVFVISGNHEYYHGEMKETDDKITQICEKLKNVEYLNNKRVDIGDTTILGTTLWSYIPQTSHQDLVNYLNDYRLITISSHLEIRTFQPADSSILFEKNIKWLEEEMGKLGKDRKVILLTHHAPLRDGTSAKKYENSPQNCAFSSDLRWFFDKYPQISTAIFGHSHFCTKFKYNDTIIASNARGYEGEVTGFNPEMCVDL